MSDKNKGQQPDKAEDKTTPENKAEHESLEPEADSNLNEQAEENSIERLAELSDEEHNDKGEDNRDGDGNNDHNVDSLEPPPQQTADTQQQPSDSSTVKQPPDKTNNSKLLPLASLVIAIASLGVAIWLYFQQQQETQQWQSTLDQHSYSVEQGQLNIKNYAQQLEEFKQAQSQLNQKQHQSEHTQALLRQQLIVAQDKMRLLNSQGKQEWLLEQADYYLTLAQQKLFYEKNASIALALLSQADQVIAEVGDLQLADLRQEIADDQARILTIEVPDTIGIISQLTSLSSSLQEVMPNSLQLPETSPDESALEDKDWQNELLETLKQIGSDAFKVSVSDEKIPHLLSAQQKSILMSAIQLAIIQAQSAVLNGEQSLFDSRLAVIKQVLQDYYKDDHINSAMSILEQLSNTQVVNLSEKVQLKSLTLLKEKKELRRLQWMSNQDTDKKQEESL